MFLGASPRDLRTVIIWPRGTRFRGEHCDGFMAQQVVLSQEYVRPLPRGVDPIEAAAAPLVFLTAYGMLHCKAQLQAGEKVLVIAGSSGVGSAAIQLARRAGARVFATAGSPAKRELCTELGAEFVVDHHDPEWAKAIRSASGSPGIDVVVEHVGPATWSQSMRCLAPGGRLVTCGGTTGPEVKILLPHLFIKNLSVLGSTMGPREALDEIFTGLASRELRPVVDRVLKMEEIQEAHRLLEGGEVVGKIVIQVGDPEGVV